MSASQRVYQPRRIHLGLVTSLAIALAIVSAINPSSESQTNA